MADNKKINVPYEIPEEPVYDPNVRKLQNDDDANAETVFNPTLAKMVENTAAVKKQLDDHQTNYTNPHFVTLREVLQAKKPQGVKPMEAMSPMGIQPMSVGMPKYEPKVEDPDGDFDYVPIMYGGTGADNLPDARKNLAIVVVSATNNKPAGETSRIWIPTDGTNAGIIHWWNGTEWKPAGATWL